MKFHALRHTYATRLFEAGVPPKTVQTLMCHYDYGYIHTLCTIPSRTLWIK
ncbi:tyrosine-type recombinase/integrase [Clostridioides difficile]|uniref:tyrosine-type recombinase/integrase n=1 Tax=Clostridioides difficile TaxID=1496 RepID=UPI001FB0A7CC